MQQTFGNRFAVFWLRRLFGMFVVICILANRAVGERNSMLIEACARFLDLSGKLLLNRS